MTRPADVVVVGAGIVGLATAYRLTQTEPGLSIVVVDKEPTVAAHQTGRNSGVLHSGIYYTPGSAKAVNCRRGLVEMIAFCESEGIPWRRCGKVIVATREEQLAQLGVIHERGIENGVVCQRIDPAELAEIEPHAAGVAAVHVEDTGIVDYGAVARRLAERIGERGGEVRLGVRVTGLSVDAGQTVVRTTEGAISCGVAVNCAGLYCDRIAARDGVAVDLQIVPFRGEYYELAKEARHLCRTLIYPVPDPSFPFLGVHVTSMIDGSVTCGPNAVLAFRREGYRLGQTHLGELAHTLTYPGFLRLAARYWKTGAAEMWRSLSRARFAASVRELVPAVAPEMLRRHPAGVRAQALRSDGTLVDDFVIEDGDAMVHVLNAPSPAATSSLAIGQVVAERVRSRLGD